MKPLVRKERCSMHLTIASLPPRAGLIFTARSASASLFVGLALSVLIALLAAGFAGGAPFPAPPPKGFGLAFTVNSTGDGGDANPGDGLCDTGAGECTLRAAIEEANAHAGDDGIFFNIPPTQPNCDETGNCSIALTQALTDLSTNNAISGPGPDKLTVRRSTGGDYRIFHVTSAGTVSFSGLT